MSVLVESIEKNGIKSLEGQVLAYSPIVDKKWVFHGIDVEPCGVVERYKIMWEISQTNELNKCKLAIVTEYGTVEGPVEFFQRIQQFDRVTIFVVHSPLVMYKSIKMEEAILLNKEYKRITSIPLTRMEKKLVIAKDDIFRVDFYWILK